MNLPGHRVRVATAAALQALFERDPAYFQEVEAAPLRANEGAEQLAELPPGVPAERKHMLVVDDVAVLDLVEGFPDPATWFLGLIFLVPEARGRGLGAQLLEDVCAAVRAQGGRALRLAVVPTNTGARRLYDRLGFVVVARRPRTGWNGVVVDVDILERAL